MVFRDHYRHRKTPNQKHRRNAIRLLLVIISAMKSTDILHHPAEERRCVRFDLSTWSILLGPRDHLARWTIGSPSIVNDYRWIGWKRLFVKCVKYRRLQTRTPLPNHQSGIGMVLLVGFLMRWWCTRSKRSTYVIAFMRMHERDDILGVGDHISQAVSRV